MGWSLQSLEREEASFPCERGVNCQRTHFIFKNCPQKFFPSRILSLRQKEVECVLPPYGIKGPPWQPQRTEFAGSNAAWRPRLGPQRIPSFRLILTLQMLALQPSHHGVRKPRPRGDAASSVLVNSPTSVLLDCQPQLPDMWRASFRSVTTGCP